MGFSAGPTGARSPSLEGVQLHGRGVRAQAALDAELVQSSEPVQVLTRLCTRPSRLRGCSPISDRMHSALESALAAPITWVDRKEVGGSLFLAFAPVEFAHHEAVTEWPSSGKRALRDVPAAMSSRIARAMAGGGCIRGSGGRVARQPPPDGSRRIQRATRCSDLTVLPVEIVPFQ